MRVIALAVLAVALAAVVADADEQPQTTVRIFDAEPFRDWVDRSETTMPEDVQVRLAPCPSFGAGMPCVTPSTRVIYFPKNWLDDPAWHDARTAFYHEAGHVFQLENNDEVQSGYPELDARCEGVYSGPCAENFADRYQACALGTQGAKPSTCAFIDRTGA